MNDAAPNPDLARELESLLPAEQTEVRRSAGEIAGYRGRGTPKLANTVVRHSYWYDAIIDWMLANPMASQKEIAAAMGRSVPTIRLLLQSDMFRSRFESRRREVSEQIATEIHEATSTVALTALREVAHRLKDNPAKIPIGQLHEIATSTLDRLGYGQKSVAPAGATNVQVNVTVPAPVLDDARRAMREAQELNRLRTPSSEPIDITPPKEQSNESAA